MNEDVFATLASASALRRVFLILVFTVFTGIGAQAQLSGQSDVGLSTVRGVITAGDEAVMSVGFSAQVIATPFRTGEAFQRGDVLLRFDCTIQDAEAAAAEAAFEASKTKYDSNIELKELIAVGQFEVDLSLAEMNQARANWEAVAARTRDCQVEAPYSGRVAELAINTYETPGIDQPILKIVASNDLELQLIVPSLWLQWLSIGTPFDFYVDETGVQYKAIVERIGAEVDAVSRTIAIYGLFSSATSNVLPGMSGSAHFVDPTN